MSFKQAVKRALPAGARIRRLPFGIGRGLRLTINLQEGQFSTYLGLYEMELNRHLRHLCPPRARSFDLGGHIGYDALVMAKLSGSDVVTVESSAHWCTTIRRNVLANPAFEKRVVVVEGYVSDTQGSIDAGDIRVTIDQLSYEFFVPDFIKIDIEGGELAALRGALQTLAGRRPNLLVEVHSAALESECLALLCTEGYQPGLIDQRRFLPDYRPIEHNRWIVAAGWPLSSVRIAQNP